MKIKEIILLSSILLIMGCQASWHATSIHEKHVRNLLSADRNENIKFIDRILSSRWHDSKAVISQDKNLWNYIRNELHMVVPENAQIREQKQKYLRNKNYLNDVILRAEPYMYWIVEQIKQRNMPMELVLLPIVESNFNPYATSSANAAGIWQIVPSTGRNYGLKQDKWYDGRRDIIASTCAVLDMMQRLNKIFHGDWLLTIAAYNSGEGRVLRAIKQNKAHGKPTDFWHLSLPRETTLYIPKLLALQDIIKNNKFYGIQLPIPNENRALARVEVRKQIKLAQAAQMAGLSVKQLQYYNTGYKRGITTLNGPHYIMVPKENIDQLRNSLTSNVITTVQQPMCLATRSHNNHDN